jgi:hypothetical protein
LAAGVPLSGTTELYGHTISWALSGASAPPADLAADYDGVVSPGTRVTFSGSASFTIGEGYATNLNQSASLSGAATGASFSQRVGGGTYTLPYSLSATAPTAPTSAEPGEVVSTITARVSSRNCNDWGVCGGPSTTVTVAVVKADPTPAPKTMVAAAWKCVKKYMNESKGTRIGRWTNRGSEAIFRNALNSVQIEVNPAALRGSANAQYLDGVITLRQDPRTVSRKQCATFGAMLYEELFHSIEDQHGDITGWQSEERAERRVNFVLEVNEASIYLEKLEKVAKARGPAWKIKKLWSLYARAVNTAIAKAKAAGYNPSITELRDWFGWENNPQTLTKKYSRWLRKIY